MAGEARAGNRFLSSRRGENSKLRKEERAGWTKFQISKMNLFPGKESCNKSDET